MNGDGGRLVSSACPLHVGGSVNSLCQFVACGGKSTGEVFDNAVESPAQEADVSAHAWWLAMLEAAICGFFKLELVAIPRNAYKPGGCQGFRHIRVNHVY